MRKLIVLMLLSSCSANIKYERNAIITGKFYKIAGIELPSCICEFEYVEENNWHRTFQDSCNKFNLLDTITRIKKINQNK